MLTQFIEVSCQKTTKGMAMESWCIGRTEFTRDTGQAIKETKKDMNGIAMETHMKETFIKVKHTEKESTTGLMERYTTANGRKV